MIDSVIRIFLALCVVALAASLIAGPKAGPKPSAGESRIVSRAQVVQIAREEAILDRRMESVSFNDVPLGDAIDSISRMSGGKIETNWKAAEGVGVDSTFPIQLHLKHPTLGRMLQAIDEDVGQGERMMDYNFDGDTIVFSTAEDFDRNTTTEIYNIRPLIEKVLKFPPSAPDETAMTSEEATDYLTKVITDTVAPDSWPDAGGRLGSIRTGRGLLVVTQTRKNQREIARLLTRLDAEMGK